jgi:hypothetical protein
MREMDGDTQRRRQEIPLVHVPSICIEGRRGVAVVVREEYAPGPWLMTHKYKTGGVSTAASPTRAAALPAWTAASVWPVVPVRCGFPHPVVNKDKMRCPTRYYPPQGLIRRRIHGLSLCSAKKPHAQVPVCTVISDHMFAEKRRASFALLKKKSRDPRNYICNSHQPCRYLVVLSESVDYAHSEAALTAQPHGVYA